MFNQCETKYSGKNQLITGVRLAVVFLNVRKQFVKIRDSVYFVQIQLDLEILSAHDFKLIVMNYV